MLVEGNSIGMVELTIRCCSSGSRILATMFIVGRTSLGTGATRYWWIACFTQVSENALLATGTGNGGMGCMTGDYWYVGNHWYGIFSQTRQGVLFPWLCGALLGNWVDSIGVSLPRELVGYPRYALTG